MLLRSFGKKKKRGMSVHNNVRRVTTKVLQNMKELGSANAAERIVGNVGYSEVARGDVHPVISACPSTPRITAKLPRTLWVGWACVDRQDGRPAWVLIRGNIEVPLAVNRLLIHIRQKKDQPVRTFVRIRDAARASG